MALSKFLRAFLTVNPLARTGKSKSLAETKAGLERILQEGSEATAAEKKKARQRLREIAKAEDVENVQRSARQSKAAPESAAKKKKLAPPALKIDSLPDDFNKGGKATKKVPVISIGVGMAEMKKSKAKMMRGGMANKKEHMYVAGGSVTDKLKPMPTGSKGKGLRNLPDSVQMNMGFNPKS